jgi:hypothetical protein
MFKIGNILVRARTALEPRSSLDHKSLHLCAADDSLIGAILSLGEGCVTNLYYSIHDCILPYYAVDQTSCPWK